MLNQARHALIITQSPIALPSLNPNPFPKTPHHSAGSERQKSALLFQAQRDTTTNIHPSPTTLSKHPVHHTPPPRQTPNQIQATSCACGSASSTVVAMQSPGPRECSTRARSGHATCTANACWAITARSTTFLIPIISALTAAERETIRSRGRSRTGP